MGSGVGGFAGGGDGLDVVGVVPGHEDLVGSGGVAEDVGPGAGGFFAVGAPELEELGVEGVAVGLEVAGEVGGDGGG